MGKTTIYDGYLRKVFSAGRVPGADFDPYLAGDRQRIEEKTGAFRQLTLNTTREERLLALAHGIVSFQTQAIHQWETPTRIKQQIYHVEGREPARFIPATNRTF